MFDIKEELKKIPHKSGVYIMHEGDLILYVGKAVDLHNRVRQYFQSPRGKTTKILQMVSRVEYPNICSICFFISGPSNAGVFRSLGRPWMP